MSQPTCSEKNCKNIAWSAKTGIPTHTKCSACHKSAFIPVSVVCSTIGCNYLAASNITGNKKHTLCESCQSTANPIKCSADGCKKPALRNKTNIKSHTLCGGCFAQSKQNVESTNSSATTSLSGIELAEGTVNANFCCNAGCRLPINKSMLYCRKCNEMIHFRAAMNEELDCALMAENMEMILDSLDD